MYATTQAYYDPQSANYPDPNSHGTEGQYFGGVDYQVYQPTAYQLPERCFPSYAVFESWLAHFDSKSAKQVAPHENPALRILTIKRLADALMLNAQYSQDPSFMKPPALCISSSETYDSSAIQVASQFVSWYTQVTVLVEIKKPDQSYRVQAVWEDVRYTPPATELDRVDIRNDSMLAQLALPAPELELAKRVELLKTDLEQGCDPNYRGPLGRTALYFVATSAQELGMQLVKAGAKLNVYDRSGRQVLKHLYDKWGSVAIDPINWGYLDLHRRNQEDLARDDRIQRLREAAKLFG